MRIAVSDLPRATRPGEPGVRVDDERRIWVPIGMNPYYFPQFARRRDFESERRAGGRLTRTTLRAALAVCSHCKILIGRGYHETELYLYVRPTKKAVPNKKDDQFKFLCGGCATSPLEMSILAGLTPSLDEKYILPFGLCLISHTDWGGRYGEYIEGHWQGALAAKKMQLLADLAQPWSDFKRACIRAHQRKYGTLETFSAERLFAQWLFLQQPTEMTFTDLFSQVPVEKAA
jgi:hypothetical protein